MSEELAKLKVTIEATAAPMKKEMEKAKIIMRGATSDIQKETRKVQNPLKGMENGAASSVRKVRQNIKNIMSSISAATRGKVKEFQIKAGIKVPTEEYKNLENDIEKAANALNKYYERRDKMEALGVSKESREWKSLEYDIKNAEAAVERYEKAKENMENSGSDVKRTVSLPKQIIGGAGKALGGLGSGIGTAVTKGWGGMTKLLGGMKSVLSSVVPVIKKASGLFGALIQKFATGIPLIRRFNSGMRQSGGSIGGSLKNVLKYTLGIRSLFVLFNRIRGSVVEGFQNLAQYSDNTNRSISALMSSLTQLKNALAAAFAPVLNVVAPILDSLIQKVISVINVFGQLTSALTGSGTYIRAKKVNQDYAASLNQNASSAKDANEANKKLQKTILGFDQINKMDDHSDSGSGKSDAESMGGLSPSDMFETVQIPNKMKNLAQQIKDAWKNADFTSIGSMIGRKLNDGLSRIPWDSIKKTTNKIAKSIATFLNGFIETTDWGLVGNTIAQGLNTAFGFVNTFAENFHWGSLGNAIGNGINGALSAIDWPLIYSAISNWGSGIAQTLNNVIGATDWTLIGNTFANGINAIFLYAQSFASAFDWNGLGAAAGNGINGALSALDWELIRSTVSGITAGIVNTLNSFMITTDWGLAGTSFAQGINTIIDFAYTAVTTFDWKQLGLSVSDFLNQAIVSVEWDKLGQILSDGIKGILSSINTVFENTDWKAIGTSLGQFINSIDFATIIKDALKALTGFGMMCLEIISGAIAETDWGKLASDLAGGIMGFFKEYDWKGSFKKLGELIGSAVAGVLDIAQYIGGAIGDSIGRAKDYFQEKIESCGGNIVKGIFKGIKDAFVGIVDWIGENIFSPFINGFKSIFGIHSPSTVMEELGGFLMDGLLGGINSLVGNVIEVFTGIESSISDVWDSITETASNVWEGISTTVGDVWEGLKTSASEKFEYIKESVTDAWDSAKETADTVWGSVKDTVGGIWDWLTGKSEKDFPEIQKDVDDSFGNVKGTSEKDWSESQKSVTDALNSMKGASSKNMRQIYKNVESYTKSIWNITANNWDAIGQKVSKVLEDMNKDISRELQISAQEFTSLRDKITNAMGDMYSVGRNAMQAFKNGFESVYIRAPHISMDYNSWSNGPGSYSWRWNSNVNWYAKGGFPDVGELFMARENGPELVGRMGRKNAVANNNQIVEGIKEGVFEAVMDAFQASDALGGSSEKDVVLELTVQADSETIYKIVRKGKKKHDGRYSTIVTV